MVQSSVHFPVSCVLGITQYVLALSLGRGLASFTQACVHVLEIYLIYVKGRERGRGKTETEIFTSQMASVAGARTGRSQEPGAPCVCHVCDQGSVVEPSHTAFPGMLAGSWVEMEQPGFKPALHYGMSADRGCRCHRQQLKPRYRNASLVKCVLNIEKCLECSHTKNIKTIYLWERERY